MTDLPEGWEWKTLGEVLAGGVFSDGDWVETKDQDPTGDVRLVQLADVGEGFFRDRSSRFLTDEAARRLNCTFLQAGDVLVARMPNPLGRACLLPQVGRPSVTAVDVCILRAEPSMADARWLMWWLNSPHVRRQVAALQSGTTRKRISRRNLAKIRLSVPPLHEQAQIVAAIEEHCSRLDSAERTLNAAARRLHAFEDALYREALMTAAPPLPLKSVAGTTSGGTPKRSRPEFFGGAIPWIKSGELGDGTISATDETLTSAGLEQSSAKLLPRGTLLIAMYGATIGRLGRIGFEHATTNQAVAAIFPSAELLPDFLWNVLRAKRRELVRSGQGGAQPNISQGILRELPVPVPTRAEQQELNQRIAEGVSIWRELTAEVQRARVRGSALRRSILAAAFSGKLVPS